MLSSQVKWSSMIFALIFMLSRPLFFGFGLWRSIWLRWHAPEVYEVPSVPGSHIRCVHLRFDYLMLIALTGVVFVTIHVLYLLGWLLQL